MTLLRAQVVLAKKSGIARDAVTNTWHFNAGTTTTAADRLAIATKLADFYIGLQSKFQETLSNQPGAHLIKVTDLALTGADGAVTGGSAAATAPAGPPDLVHPFTLTPGGGGQVAEVAAVLTLEANSVNFSEEVGNTRPAARRRGRIFLGPIASAGQFAQDLTTMELRLSDSFVTAATGQGQSLSNQLAQLSPPVSLVVFSRAEGIAREVTHFSMSNAPAIVRSRGVRPTLRTRVAAVDAVLAA